MKRKLGTLSFMLALSGFLIWSPSTFADDFYEGKTVFIMVGSAPGGGFDTYARILARHLPSFIPGQPTMVVKNRGGGAGNLLTANAVYNTEAKDGTVIGTFAEGLILEQVLGRKGIDFDSARFQWLGSMTKGTKACIVRTETGVKRLTDTMSGKQIFMATTGPGSDLHTVPAIVADLGAKWKLIPGYGGSSKLLLAMESKEADGFCATFRAIARRVKELVKGENPAARFIVVTGFDTPDHPFLKGVPTWYVLAKNDEQKQLLTLNDSAREVSKPYAVAPEVPKERVAILRKALAAAVNDPKVSAEIEKTGLDIDYTDGENVTRIVRQLQDTPEPLLKKMRTILGIRNG